MLKTHFNDNYIDGRYTRSITSDGKKTGQSDGEKTGQSDFAENQNQTSGSSLRK